MNANNKLRAINKTRKPGWAISLPRLVAVAVVAVACVGCYQSPKADQLTYSEDGVENVESALTDYDWSEFEP